MLNGNTGGSGGKLHIAQYRLQNTRGGAIEEVSSANHSIYQCTIPESTNDYFVKAKLSSVKRDTGVGENPPAAAAQTCTRNRVNPEM